jgi:hypothetical protein
VTLRISSGGIIVKSLTAIALGTAAVLALSSTPSFATTWTITEKPNHTTTYCVHYVEAVYTINPKGILVRGPTSAWKGDFYAEHKPVT